MLAALGPGVLAVLRFGAFHRWVDAEDLTQETLKIVIARVRNQTFDDPRKIYAFAAATARNLALNAARKVLHSKQAVDSDLVNELAQTLEAEQSDLRSTYDRRLAQAVESLLEELPNERDRQLLTRFYLDGIDKRVLCRDLGLSPKHFDRVIMRARTRMRAFIERRMQPTVGAQPRALHSGVYEMSADVGAGSVSSARASAGIAQFAFEDDLTDIEPASKSRAQKTRQSKRTGHSPVEVSGISTSDGPRRELLDSALLTAIDRVSAIPQSEVSELLKKIRKSGNPKALIIDEVLTHDIPSRNVAALERAFERGERSKAEILAQPDMLTGQQLAKLLGMSRATVDLRRQQDKLLAVDFGSKRGVRYPAWQAEILLDPDKRKVFEQALAKLSKLSPWSRYRFFMMSSAALGSSSPMHRFKNAAYEKIVEAAEAWAEGDESTGMRARVAAKR